MEPKQFEPESPAPLLMMDEMWLKQRSKIKKTCTSHGQCKSDTELSSFVGAHKMVTV